MLIPLPLLLAGLLLAQSPAGGGARPAAELIDAARLGDLERASHLLEAGADAETRDRRGMTPLMWAAASGNLELVELLLARGARLTVRARDGSTALMLAAENGAGPIVQALVSRGADVNATRGTATARHLAQQRGHLEIAEFLQRAETLGADLLRAAGAAHTTLIRQLLALGAPVNTSDERGATVLMMAAADAHLGLMQYLLARGADPAQPDANGHTAFDWAERSPQLGPVVVSYLTERGFARPPADAPAAATAPPVRESLRTLTALVKRVPARPATDADRRRAADALDELMALSARWPPESPEDYRASLQTLVDTLDATLDAGDPQHLGATVAALADDLEDKLEHCRASGGKLGGLVRVEVRTLRGSDEVSNWQVFYMPRIFELSETARPDVFPRFTSPSAETLAPGRYLMWLRDPASGATGPRTIVRVGEGRSELLVDLPVPPDAAP